jgi:hypothetical protein
VVNRIRNGKTRIGEVKTGEIMPSEIRTGCRFRYFLLALLALWLAPLQAADVSVKLDRNSIVEGETVTLSHCPADAGAGATAQR